MTRSIPWRSLFLMVMALTLFGVSSVFPCTAFSLAGDGTVILGKNLDWSSDRGIIQVNKRNRVKEVGDGYNSHPAKWVSLYGSVTFNHISCGFPLGGMNEAGLVVESLNLFYSAYPKPDERPAMDAMQWIQYQLDNSAVLEDVIDSARKIRIEPVMFRLHYLVCDRSGRRAVIEFLNGKMTVYKDGRLPVPVLANNKYGDSLKNLLMFKGFGGERPVDDDYINRFAGAAEMIRMYDPDSAGGLIEYGFKILDKTKHSDDTKWSIIYDPVSFSIFYRTSRSPALKVLHVSDFDFGSECAPELLDVNNGFSGRINGYFKAFDHVKNKRHIEEVFAELVENGDMDEMPSERLIEQMSAFARNIPAAGAF